VLVVFTRFGVPLPALLVLQGTRLPELGLAHALYAPPATSGQVQTIVAAALDALQDFGLLLGNHALCVRAERGLPRDQINAHNALLVIPLVHLRRNAVSV